MRPRALKAVLLVASISTLAPSAAIRAEEPQTAALYAEHCASCHGVDRLGGTGPALLPENLGRLRAKQAIAVIAGGRAATQMPAFGDEHNAHNEKDEKPKHLVHPVFLKEGGYPAS